MPLSTLAALTSALCRQSTLTGLEGLLSEHLGRLLEAREWLVDVSAFELNRPALLRGNVDDAWARRYNQEFYKLNPGSSAVKALCRRGGPWVRRFADLCPEPLLETRFFREYMQPQRHRFSLVGAMPLTQANAVAQAVVVLVVRYDDQVDFSDADLQILELLLPAVAWAAYGAMRSSEEWTAAVVRHAFGLSPKLAETAVLVAQGLSNREVADRLGIAVGTTKHYVHQVFELTGASSRADLCRLILG